MRLGFLAAAALLAGLAACTEHRDSPARGVADWIDRSPGARLYTGQGQMGTGGAGDNDGAGGPSQNPGVAPKH